MLRHKHTSRLLGWQSPTYISWSSMKQRCDNPASIAYKNYGGRGITYDPAWADFVLFLEDMGEKPAGTSLDRIDNDKNYNKTNCRWATRREQNLNTRKQSNPFRGITVSGAGRYRVMIQGKHLGMFDNLEDAQATAAAYFKEIYGEKTSA